MLLGARWGRAGGGEGMYYPLNQSIEARSICTRSLTPYYMGTYNIKWVKTYWTYSIMLI